LQAIYFFRPREQSGLGGVPPTVNYIASLHCADDGDKSAVVIATQASCPAQTMNAANSKEPPRPATGGLARAWAGAQAAPKVNKVLAPLLARGAFYEKAAWVRGGLAGF
jgi:hypothetical protein